MYIWVCLGMCSKRSRNAPIAVLCVGATKRPLASHHPIRFFGCRNEGYVSYTAVVRDPKQNDGVARKPKEEGLGFPQY